MFEAYPGKEQYRLEGAVKLEAASGADARGAVGPGQRWGFFPAMQPVPRVQEKKYLLILFFLIFPDDYLPPAAGGPPVYGPDRVSFLIIPKALEFQPLSAHADILDSRPFQQPLEIRTGGCFYFFEIRVGSAGAFTGMKHLEAPESTGRRKKQFHSPEKPLPPFTGYKGIPKINGFPRFPAPEELLVEHSGKSATFH
jgi:hypothetical protein